MNIYFYQTVPETTCCPFLCICILISGTAPLQNSDVVARTGISQPIQKAIPLRAPPMQEDPLLPSLEYDAPHTLVGWPIFYLFSPILASIRNNAITFNSRANTITTNLEQKLLIGRYISSLMQFLFFFILILPVFCTFTGHFVGGISSTAVDTLVLEDKLFLTPTVKMFSLPHASKPFI